MRWGKWRMVTVNRLQRQGNIWEKQLLIVIWKFLHFIPTTRLPGNHSHQRKTDNTMLCLTKHLVEVWGEEWNQLTASFIWWQKRSFTFYCCCFGWKGRTKCLLGCLSYTVCFLSLCARISIFMYHLHSIQRIVFLNLGNETTNFKKRNRLFVPKLIDRENFVAMCWLHAKFWAESFTEFFSVKMLRLCLISWINCLLMFIYSLMSFSIIRM